MGTYGSQAICGWDIFVQNTLAREVVWQVRNSTGISGEYLPRSWLRYRPIPFGKVFFDGSRAIMNPATFDALKRHPGIVSGTSGTRLA